MQHWYACYPLNHSSVLAKSYLQAGIIVKIQSLHSHLKAAKWRTSPLGTFPLTTSVAGVSFDSGSGQASSIVGNISTTFVTTFNHLSSPKSYT